MGDGGGRHGVPDLMGPSLARGAQLVLTTGMLSFVFVLVGLTVVVSEPGVPPEPAPTGVSIPPAAPATRSQPESATPTSPVVVEPPHERFLPGPEQGQFTVTFQVAPDSEEELAALLADPAKAPGIWILDEGGSLRSQEAPTVDRRVVPLPEMKGAKLCVTRPAADSSWEVSSGDPPFSDTSTLGTLNLVCTPQTDLTPPHLFPIVLEFR